MQLKDLLEELTEKYNVQAFIDTDPVQFPRRFSRLQDVEVSALLTSVITWGRRDMVRRDAQRLHEAMGDSPFDFIIEGGWQRWRILRATCTALFLSAIYSLFAGRCRGFTPRIIL
ncbi:hypothetical protein JCM15093_2500 [Bacteroides graminisolvens DSM 19988 = JCM 15093]|uniref:Uncharacterized protein n=1 Tax=Bacteroides graminisolvens DSM 19988 = JCM 15093 TaxID=1121097 RepID=A0A069D4B5_9BACE|nr:DUF2400 family protein [Bacteroides graminisolvens]GAK37262.1 hypothetical protein JCM15093_2500 [Bacteroides graminisolvens DSM 19988 = JCM 15093]